jgi:hypothetical protein
MCRKPLLSSSLRMGIGGTRCRRTGWEISAFSLVGASNDHQAFVKALDLPTMGRMTFAGTNMS